MWRPADNTLQPQVSTRWNRPHASKILTHFQTSHGYTVGSGCQNTNLNDTSDFVIGTQAVSWQSKGAGAQAALKNFSVTSFDATGKNFRIVMKVDSIAHLKELTFYAGDTNLTNYYKWSFQVPIAGSTGYNYIFQDNEWAELTLNFMDATTGGSPNRAAITALQFATYDDNTGNPVQFRVNSIELVADGSATLPYGAITICFDDSYGSVYSIAKPIMDAYGYTGTIFNINDVLGKVIRMTEAQLLTLAKQGWEVGGHAYTDADHALTYPGLTTAQLEQDALASRRWQLNRGLVRDGCAYPLGAFNPTVINTIKKFYGYARTTVSRSRETLPPADPYKLRAVSSISTYSGGLDPATVYTDTTGLIDKAKANAAWLIMVFHDIQPSSVTATTQILTADFTSIIAKIASAGVPVLNPSDVMRRMQ